jgi:sigma-B regulation protein RsbU (phosphoserine phosphatase)
MHSRLEQKLQPSPASLRSRRNLNASLDPDDVLPSILKPGPTRHGCPAVSVALVDEATNELVYIEATGEHGSRVKGGLRLKVGPGSIAAGWPRNGQPLVIADVPAIHGSTLPPRKKSALIRARWFACRCVAQAQSSASFRRLTRATKRFSMRTMANFFQAFASFAATAIQNAHLHKALLIQQSEQQETEFARQIQESFLPKTIPVFEGISIASHYEPAREVGGDFYDIIQLSPAKVGLVVGDVTGKGIAASLYMVRCLFETRRLASAVSHPRSAQ